MAFVTGALTAVKMFGGKIFGFLYGLLKNPKVAMVGYAVLITMVVWLGWTTSSLRDDKEELQKQINQAESDISLLEGQRKNLREKLDEQNAQVQKWKQEAEEVEQRQEERLQELREEFEDRAPVDTETPEELNKWLDKLFSE